jgi:hypothetical protein
VVISDTKPQGLTTGQILREFSSVSYGQNVIKRAEDLELIDRVEADEPLQKEQYKPKYHRLTEKGRRLLLQSQLLPPSSQS